MVLPDDDVDDDDRELESLEELEPDDEVELELDDVVDLDEVAASEVPGIVAALTAVKMPRPATAAMPAPAVRRLSRRSAASRASGDFVVSMGPAWLRSISRPLELAGICLGPSGWTCDPHGNSLSM
jgi:hypothetical protein